MGHSPGSHDSGRILFSPFGRNRKPHFRLCLEKKRYSLEERDERMVKGVSKRIIVVNNPDRRFFEQAIFILRSDSAATQGISEKELLRQARRAAHDYLRRGENRVETPIRRFRGLLCALGGAALTAGAWFAMQLF